MDRCLQSLCTQNLFRITGNSAQFLKPRRFLDVAPLSLMLFPLFVKAAYEAGYAKCLPNDIEIHILTHGYITALCECVLHDVPYKKAEDYVKNIIKFQHYGWYGVLGLPLK